MVVLRSGFNKADNLINEVNDGEGKQSKETEDKLLKKIQLIAFISLIIDLLGFTVILPLFPALLEYYAKHDSSGLYLLLQKGVKNLETFLNVPNEFNSVLFGGVLGSLFSLLQFISSPICGALSDFYGRKPILIFCLVGMAFSYGLWFMASNFTIFVLSRVIGGLCKGNVSLTYSIMTDILDAKSRSRGMAFIGIAFSLGFIIGPVIGVGFSKWGTSGWFAASAFYAFFLAVINIAFFSIYFQETLPKDKRIKKLETGFKEALKFLSPMKLFKFEAVSRLSSSDRSHLTLLGSVYFMYLFVYSGLEFTVTFVTHYRHGFDSMAQGKMFMFLGIVMAIVQGGFIRRIKFGQEKILCIIGLCILIPSFCIIGISTSKFFLYLGLGLYAVGSSLMVSCLTAMASQIGPASQKGTILGIWRSLGALARSIGPVVACFGFWWLGCGLSYTVGGLSLLFPLYLLNKFHINTI